MLKRIISLVFFQGSSVVRGSIRKQDGEDKRLLCRDAKRETVFESCPSSSATTQGSSGLEEYKQDSRLSHSSRHRNDSCSSIGSIQSISSTQSMNITAKACCYGIKCFKVDCEFDHPDGWNRCSDGIKCENYECTANHPFKRKAKCRDGNRCKTYNCKFLHPNTRDGECPLRAKCQKWNCPKLHPRSRPRSCSDKQNCTNLACLCLHPPERTRLLCPIAADCRDLSCKLNHPCERPSRCDQPDTCSNFNCTRLHGPDWNPCEAGDEITAATTTDNKKKKSLKSLEQRMKDWRNAQLPILSYRSEFCQRLDDERMLVVTAETGSGKSTQLPQYAAEYFGSLVVCTQPRVVAALSLAHRVAEEYDGTSVGESVGYKVGSGKRVTGSSIMFMTDAALIRDSQRDPTLKHIRVLIIDEAHERSLNTDIVLGIAKLLLAQRSKDFYVVIASATIDPTRFLQFFDRPTSIPLEVQGRVFPVTVANKPPPSDCSDQKLIEIHIVPTVIELYPHHKGHTLVFLPGQGEIEKALKIFKSKIPDDCIALPLYGSQSPEDQEKVIKFNEKSKRMVVFCTNVAETSLTIPNVRLVIDSGWAKEARYDMKRRLTVIETVRISRSSADQRKGRAGRTAPGHCERLYSDAELKRANIEPEILRSSLDLVLLQLVRLNFDPKTFPFMDQPNSDTISNSIDLLTRLQCINGQKITERGELFAELGLDPRLSAFIVEIYTEYKSLLELAAGIVGILSAPGSIFFMGGATKEAKEEAKMKVALQAQNYESDLIHLYLVYDAWKNASTKQIQGKCLRCIKQVKWCICRIKHSNENGLNNKILQNIDTSSTSIIRQIKNACWLKPGSEMPQNPMNIISKQLAQLFPEQCGYLLVPELPAEGVRLISTDIRANITNTSVFMQKLHTDSNDELYQHFVAMTITQLSSGNYIIERLHPIPRSLATVQSSIQHLMNIENISSEVFYRMRQKLNTHRSEPWAKWVVYQYNRPHCRFILWGLESEKSKIVPIVQQTHNEILKKFYDAYELLECGPIKANFQSGLICTHINKMTNTLRLDLKNVPNLKFNELKDWLKEIIGIEWDEIKQHRFHTVKVETHKQNDNDQSQSLYLIFKNEDAFQRATKKTPAYYLNEQGNSFGIRRDNEKDAWGRELIIQTPINITVQDIINRYGVHVITNSFQLNKQNEKARVESALKLNNLPLTSGEIFLRECLQVSNGPQPKHIYVGRAKNNTSGWAKITFDDVEQRDKAAVIYQLKLCQNLFPIIIQGKKGHKQKFVKTVLERDDKTHFVARNLFRITIVSREETLRIFSEQTTTNMNWAAATSISKPMCASEWTFDSSATVTILRTDLYPNVQQIVKHICDKFRVKFTSRNLPNYGKRYTFTYGSPQKTSLAASMLAQNFAPMNIKLNTDRQKQLFNELEEVGEIQKWATELCLAINKNKYNTNIEIRGPQIAQGQLMRRIADYSDHFNERFREHELSTTVAAFFGRQKAASSRLQEIASQWSSKSCFVSFIPKTSTIIIIGKPNVLLGDINDCEKEVIQLLNELTATTNDDESEEDDDEEEQSDMNNIKATRQDRHCVFCKQKSSISTNLFRICGHAYCRCAAQSLNTSTSFPLRCKDCQTNIHIRDIEIIFSNDEQLFMNLIKNSLQNYLTTNTQQDDRVFCPNHECNGLIKFNLGYQTCLTCGQSVCSKCQIIDDELHVGQTCNQFLEAKESPEFLTQLFIAAKKFVKNNWPIDDEMQPIGRIDINPYLEKRYKSLKRFYQGMKILGHPFPPDLSKGFFAYHGTTPQAIVSICENGFDPERRSGQVHGRGEYFGMTAGVSHGYTQKGSQSGIRQMIITFLLRCPQITTKENFCYIVDNPVDWKYAFNLPVLIVTYGQMADTQPSPFPKVIPDYVDDNNNNETSWNAPFRWYWCQDNGQFEPYNDTINRILEKCYELWKLHGGPSVICTPPLTRYFDDTPQIYQIDYQNKRQTNIKTSHQRSIDRRLINSLSDNHNWFYRDEHGNWMPYEPMVQNLIEKAFQSYRSGKGLSIIDIQYPDRPEIYQINFLIGHQMNKSTSAIKSIKYEEKCPDPVNIGAGLKFFRKLINKFF
jgi:HrpA-like RNA helicase